jgi:hypothetical protein
VAWCEWLRGEEKKLRTGNEDTNEIVWEWYCKCKIKEEFCFAYKKKRPEGWVKMTLKASNGLLKSKKMEKVYITVFSETFV